MPMDNFEYWVKCPVQNVQTDKEGIKHGEQTPDMHMLNMSARVVTSMEQATDMWNN